MRRLIEFPCEGETLVGTLDEAPGETGLLVVSGGNEVRMGAHRGMAQLAARIAAEAGAPVLRFDRRGIGDSTGVNHGFDHSSKDLAAAAAAFRARAPQVKRIIGFGNCDAATALALYHRPARIDAVVLANPWVIEGADELPPAAAIRSRYAERLRDPRQWLRLISGGVNLRKLFKGLAKASKSERAPLAARMAATLTVTDTPVAILLAKKDNTAIAFAEAWRNPLFDNVRRRIAVHEYMTDSHSFAREADKEWLFAVLRNALAQ